METEREGLGRIYATYGEIIAECCGGGAVRPPVMGGLIWRESRGGAALTPPGPGGTGDGGHGRGLCQIDDRSWPDFCASDVWKDPHRNIAFAVKLLGSELAYFERMGEDFYTPYTAMHCALAAYNSGPGNVRKALANGDSPDLHTAHANYGSEVIRLSRIYADIEAQESRSTTEIDVTGFGGATE